MTTRCIDCQAIYILPLVVGTRYQHRCDRCRQTRINRQKLAAQHRRRQIRPDEDRKDHLTEAEIDRIFAAALKEARRQRSDSLEPARSYEFLYREPRG